VSRAEDSAACNRLSLILNAIDFDSIKAIADIGCRYLEQTAEMAVIFPEATFYSFEPVASSYQRCVASLAELDEQYRKRINVYELALNDTTGPITFYPADDPAVSSKYQFIPGLNGSFFGKSWQQTETVVQGMRMDDWKQQNNIGPIDMLWVDVQGAELDVFKGAEQTLKDVRVILTEVGVSSYYEGQSLKPEIDEYLIAQGFRELTETFSLHFALEGNTIYIKD
jgi:FkbM family methyltransferase